jgi:hypothetical protein
MNEVKKAIIYYHNGLSCEVKIINELDKNKYFVEDEYGIQWVERIKQDQIIIKYD